MALANAKLGAVHGLAGVIGGIADVPHGIACAALLAPVFDANVQALRSGPPGHPALERYAQAARLLTGDPAASVEDGLAWIGQTLTLLAVSGLAVFGIRPQHADEIAAKAQKSSSMQGNTVALSHRELAGMSWFWHRAPKRGYGATLMPGSTGVAVGSEASRAARTTGPT